MSQLDTNHSYSRNPRVQTRHGNPLKKLYADLQVLAKYVFSAVKPKNPDLVSEQIETSMTVSQRISCDQEITQGCKAHLNDTEYQHKVEQGNWHHRRQRRRTR